MIEKSMGKAWVWWWGGRLLVGCGRTSPTIAIPHRHYHHPPTHPPSFHPTPPCYLLQSTSPKSLQDLIFLPFYFYHHQSSQHSSFPDPISSPSTFHPKPMSTTVAVKPVRKFPPPCWTRDEALVLIEAYRERWYALHRAFLRNPDWDAVAEKVTTSCPDVTPPKTSAQCRHKMEKLRQRHRTEKQRAASFPGGRFFSSWFYFEAMEAMENGPSSEPGNNNSSNPEVNNATPVSDHQSLNPGRGIRFKPPSVQNLVTLAASSTNHTPDFDSRFSNRNSSYMNNWSNQDDDNEDGYLDDSTINETSIHPGYKNHKSVKGGIRIKPSIPSHQESVHLRPRKFSKVVQEHEVDENGEMWIKVPRNTNLFQGNNQNGNSWSPNLDQGKKRGDGGIQEVVASIKLLGDGFMKMEKMKIDMAREIERMRMETEMKRNQLILESQKQIVDAFLKGSIETRRQPKTETMAD